MPPHTPTKTRPHNCRAVESLAFTPPSVADDDAELIVGAREDHRLHAVKLGTLAHRTINMNANGDSWVSFTCDQAPHRSAAHAPYLPSWRWRGARPLSLRARSVCVCVCVCVFGVAHCLNLNAASASA